MAWTVFLQGVPCAWCVSVTTHGNIFWFQSHQEKDAACVQHLHCSYVRHVLPGCPFWIPNFLRWGLVLLPVQSIVLALSSVAASYVELLILYMHHLCMLVSICSSVICSYTLENFPNAFPPSSGQIVYCISGVPVDFFKNSNILKTGGVSFCIVWFTFTLITFTFLTLLSFLVIR